MKTTSNTLDSFVDTVDNLKGAYFSCQPSDCLSDDKTTSRIKSNA